MGWWMLFGGLLWIAFWGTVIYLIVSFIRGPQAGGGKTQEDPISILNRRYAHGEIDKEEYDRIRRDLSA